MAALTNAQILKAGNHLADTVLSSRFIDINRVDLDAAVVAVNTWIDNNAASFNSALPLAVRNSLSAAEKSALLYHVALVKYGG